jgi:tRNA A-37 threonylcarbamoyl transferase component Bud32
MKRMLAGERYELEDRLGHGGMATVYRARDLKLDREVAIKLLAENLAGDDEIRKRFSREARLAARLDHPNVVQVFDVGEDEDRPFIVMEHVEGGTLGDRLSRRRRTLDRGESLRLLGQLCDGLGHAHAKKLIHRDIKPQNLLLRSSDDCLKITDFGIARAAEETTRLTRPGKVIGTDRYMAPEQLADGRITPATDVYACGVVADELLPESRSPELSEIIGRCRREDPEMRFTDASELGEALASVEGNGAVGVVRRIKSQGRTTQPLPAGQSTANWPAPTDVRSGKPRRRGGRVRLAAALALIAAVAAIGAVIAIRSGDSGSPTSAKGDRRPAAPVAVPRSGDPATQARELADFLRAQSRPGGAGAQQPQP